MAWLQLKSESKVSYFDAWLVRVIAQENVHRLEVSMDQMLGMHVSDSKRYLYEHMLDFFLCEPTIELFDFVHLLPFNNMLHEVATSCQLSYQEDLVIQIEFLYQVDNIWAVLA